MVDTTVIEDSLCKTHKQLGIIGSEMSSGDPGRIAVVRITYHSLEVEVVEEEANSQERQNENEGINMQSSE